MVRKGMDEYAQTCEGAFVKGDLEASSKSLEKRNVAAGLRTIVLSFGNPYLVEDLGGVSAFVVGYGEGGFYGNQIVYADAFLRLLKGEIAAPGKAPVAGLEVSR